MIVILYFAKNKNCLCGSYGITNFSVSNCISIPSILVCHCISPPSNQINYCLGEEQNNSLDETEISVSDFIISASSEHGKIQIEWTHALPQTTRVCTYVISSIEKYNDRISRSFLPWYKNGERAK